MQWAKGKKYVGNVQCIMVVWLQIIVWKEVLDSCKVALHIEHIAFCMMCRGATRKTPRDGHCKVESVVNKFLQSGIHVNISRRLSLRFDSDEGNGYVEFQSCPPLVRLQFPMLWAPKVIRKVCLPIRSLSGAYVLSNLGKHLLGYWVGIGRNGRWLRLESRIR